MPANPSPKLIVYVFVGLISWCLVAGMFFSSQQAIAAKYCGRLGVLKDRRSNAGLSIALGTLFGAAWPIGLPLAWCLTGFAEHGVWRDYAVLASPEDSCGILR